MINGAWVFIQSENGVKKRGVSEKDGVQANKLSSLTSCKTSFTAMLAGVENYGVSADPLEDIDADELVRLVVQVEEQAKRNGPMCNEAIQTVQPTMMSGDGLRANLMIAEDIEGSTETDFDGDSGETGWNDGEFGNSEDEEEDYNWDEMHEFVRNDRALVSESDNDDDDFVEPPPRPEKKKKKATPGAEAVELTLEKTLKHGLNLEEVYGYEDIEPQSEEDDCVELTALSPVCTEGVCGGWNTSVW
ncbi:unnamed protein product [Cochlearia groenlandica]